MEPMRASRSAAAILIATFATAGCGDDDGGTSPGTDAGIGGDAAAFVAAPQIPWLDPVTNEGEPPIAPPVLRPCPAGWRETLTDTGLEVCDPWPEGGPIECPIGQAHFLGEPGCTTVGDPCPAGDFPEGLPAGATVRYVDTRATEAPDGSMARPFPTIGEALVGATPGTILALAKGRYDGRIVPPEGVTLWGACSAETVLTRSVRPALGENGGLLDVTVPAVVVRNVRIEDLVWVTIYVAGASASLELDGVVMSNNMTQSIWARFGARLVARDLVVDGTRPRDLDGAAGNAIGIEGASADIERAVLLRNHYTGIVATSGATFTLRDVTIRDTRPEQPEGIAGYGIVAGPGSTATIARVHVAGVRTIGIGASGIGSRMDISDAIVARVGRQMSDDEGGTALLASLGAEVDVRRLYADAASGSGLMVGADASLIAEDVVVRESPGSTVDEADGSGFIVGADASPARATLQRAVIERTRHGILSSGAGTSLQIEDVRIHDLRLPPGVECCTASGINLVGGVAAVLRRVSIGSLRTHAISAEGSTVDLEDVAVRDVDSNAFGHGYGLALRSSAGSTVHARRFVAKNVQGVAVLIDGLTTARMNDLVVVDSRPEPDVFLGGEGIVVQVGSSLDLERAVIAGHYGVGLLAIDMATVDGRDVRIGETRQLACAESTCAGAAGGTGLVGASSSSVRLERFEIGPADLCGAQVARASSLDLSIGTVHDATIGACIQVPDYDTRRVSDRVVYERNEANLQATTLPVPEPVVPLTM